MYKNKKLLLLSIVSGLFFAPAVIASEFMDAEWAKQACAAWNKDEVLTTKLMQMPEDMFGGEGYRWIKNDAGRGYKLIQIYRDGCEASKIQMNIAEKDGKAMCVYGGKPDGKKMNGSVDYVMYASDKDWTCMGSGACGVMGSMMTGKLKFKGSKVEAMKVMEPFANFLKLTGKVPGNKGECK